MKTVKIVPLYFLWHYILSWKDAWGVYTNFLWFVWNYFSIPLLLRTLFSPWRRLQEMESGFLSNLFITTIMRFVGAGVRVCTIALGLVAFCATGFAGVVAVVLWILAPWIALLLIGFGVLSLFS